MAPLNDGLEPVGSVIVKEFSGKEFKAPRGSLRSLRVSSPMLIIVVVTFKFSNPSMLTLGVEVLRVRPGMAETATTKVTREMREARRMEENIVVKRVKAVETLGLKEPDLNTFQPSPLSPKVTLPDDK